MFTDAVVDLVEAGVDHRRPQGAQPRQDRDRVPDGHARLYDFVDDNPMVEMRPVDFTNDTPVIRSFSRMMAINSAIEVDLTGQVVADSIGHRIYSGVGGQMDFIRGAALAERGPGDHRPAVDGGRRDASRGSSPTLQPGAGVVTTRAHVRTVVTECGVAELFGRSLRERARRSSRSPTRPSATAASAEARAPPTRLTDPSTAPQDIRRMKRTRPPAECPPLSTNTLEAGALERGRQRDIAEAAAHAWPAGSIG